MAVLKCEIFFVSFSGDTYKTVMHSHGNKKLAIESLTMHLEQLERDTAQKLEEIDGSNNVINVSSIFMPPIIKCRGHYVMAYASVASTLRQL
jgi:hypothetical protein